MNNYPHSTIGEICDIIKGETGLASASPGKYPLVTTGAERKTCKTYQFDLEAVCIPLVSSTGHGKKSLNYVHYQKGKFALGTILAAVIPKEPNRLSAAFLHRYLQFYKDIKIVPLMKGAANVSLAVKDIAKIEIPLPPIDKQISFIELFNKLTDSSAKLQNEFSIQTNYSNLLRQSILQEAIEGKLTEAWRKKNPVRKGDPGTDVVALLDKIKAEKQKLIAEGKIRKEKPLAPIKLEEVPFELPGGWVWTRFSDVVEIASNLVSPNRYPTYIQIAPEDIEKATGKLIGERKTVKEKEIISGNHIFHSGMLLYSKVRPRLKKIVSVDYDGLCSADMYPLRPYVHVDYIKFLMLSEYFDNEVYKFDNRVKMPKINQNQLNSILIPIPPIAEQKIIVERVGRLMTIVDELEMQVGERKEQVEQLMQTVLREAFEVSV